MGLSIFPGIKWSGVMGNYNEENILVRLNQPGSVYQLAIFRILLGLEIVYVSASSIFRYLSLVPDVAYNTNVFPGLINQWVETIAISYLVAYHFDPGCFFGSRRIDAVYIAASVDQFYASF